MFILDKGGTLIDVHSMWGDWVTELARRLKGGGSPPVWERLFRAMGFDRRSGRIAPDGWLATTMAELRQLTVELLCTAGLSQQPAEAIMEDAWYAHDPVAMARPLADLPALFRGLRERGAKTAVATIDGGAPTEATFNRLNINRLVDALVCGDDDLPPKPAPDMVQAVSTAVEVDPALTVVVGDTVADMRMGRAAGVGLVLGVLCGVSS
ncbi:MAG: HAD hydrolase-like protein, partial [Anaerolineae bacterium]